LHSGQVHQRLGTCPLVLGMPVVLTTNYDVEAGIVNGTHGVLKGIRYQTDAQGRRHATSCLVHTPDLKGDPLPGLLPGHVPVLAD
ncbi:hypothetical protein CALVIDRAFT_456141, partial [Calocera viscosa TUFC12733]